MPKGGYVRNSGGEANEAWVEQELEGGWVAAFRILRSKGGGAVVAEVRVFPDETFHKLPWASKTRQPGRWAGEDRGVEMLAPPGGLPISVLRSIALGPIYAVLERKAASGYPKPTWDDLFGYRMGFTAGIDPGPRRPGRRGRDDRHYASVAALYLETCREATKDEDRDVMTRLGGKLHLSESTIRGQLGEARRRGLLTEAPAGRSGGELTNRARQILRGEP